MENAVETNDIPQIVGDLGHAVGSTAAESGARCCKESTLAEVLQGERGVARRAHSRKHNIEHLSGHVQSVLSGWCYLLSRVVTLTTRGYDRCLSGFAGTLTFCYAPPLGQLNWRLGSDYRE